MSLLGQIVNHYLSKLEQQLSNHMKGLVENVVV